MPRQISFRSWLLIGLFFLCLRSGAQLATLHSESHLVDSTLSVHDAAGRVVPDLTQQEFAITEDGVPQTVRFFSFANQQPLSIALVLDVSGSQERFVREHEHDVEVFLRQTLLPQDRAFLVCFGNHLRLVSGWSGDAAALTGGLRAFNKGSRDSPELGPAEERELGTALYDAVYFSIEDRLAQQQQRTRILVVFTDGEENSSEHDLIDAIAAAQNGNVLVYAIRYTDVKHGKMNARNRYGARVLDHLADQTGGRVYDAHTLSLKDAFAEISADARSLYTVGYQSSNHEHDGSFRKVVIRSTRPGVTIRSRGGYYGR